MARQESPRDESPNVQGDLGRRKSLSISTPPLSVAQEVASLLSSADRIQQDAARLILQAEVYKLVTARFFSEARIGEGMQVLDIGSGTGDVSILVSELVGSTGSVMGIDRNAVTVEIATEHARKAGKANVMFVHDDVESMNLTGRFDAIVGRFVLRELKDPVRSLRKLSHLLAPEGIIAFQEKVLALPVTTFPHLSLVDQICSWMDAVRHRAGVELAMGAKLPSFYLAAGLPSPHLRFDAPVGYGPDWVGYEYLVETLRGMLPLIYLYSIASEADIGIDDLTTRMRTEAGPATMILTPCIGAWAVRRSP